MLEKIKPHYVSKILWDKRVLCCYLFMVYKNTGCSDVIAVRGSPTQRQSAHYEIILFSEMKWA